MVSLGNDWDEILKDEFKRDYYLKLREFLKSEYKNHTIHPDMYDIFNALKWTSYKDTKVVILGQDPYHGENQAHGLAFSVMKDVKIPPSLLNMYKELRDSLGLFIPNNGYLEKWARQGVLLLNATLTVREGLASFQGVQRRFDIRLRNEKVCYIDDYAHHPEEIKASLMAVRDIYPEKEMTLIFQPHLFSRTRDFMNEFAEALSLADRLLLMEIYPAREKPIEGITSSVLLEKVTCKHKQICSKEELLDTIKEINPELIITMGAGDIDRFVPQIETLLKS
jgi:hypothetical protein